MGLFRAKEILGIAEETLQFVLDAAEDTHPNEYMGLLRGESARSLGLNQTGIVITNVLVIPGTKSNSVSATVRSSMIPNDRSGVGSIHSHPNGVLRPSTADEAVFSSGRVNIIIGAPYESDCWRAFDREAQPMDLPVIDIRLPDPTDFFDFTEEDLLD